MKSSRIVDLSYLKDMSEGNKEIMDEMIEIFVSQVFEFSDEMKELYKRKEYFKLGNLAHKAKSSISIMGMENLAKELKEFELLAKAEKETDKYEQFISNFEASCKQAVEELKEMKE